MKVTVLVHCGNAPKMGRSIDLLVALCTDDARIQDMIRDDFYWNVAGTEKDHTLMDHQAGWSSICSKKIRQLDVTNAMSHGNAGMAEALMLYDDGTQEQVCFVVTFASTAKNALIKDLRVYRQNLSVLH